MNPLCYRDKFYKIIGEEVMNMKEINIDRNFVTKRREMEEFMEYLPFLIPLIILQIILQVFALVHLLKYTKYCFGNNREEQYEKISTK